MANLITDDAMALTWVGSKGTVSIKTFKSNKELAEFALRQMSLDDLRSVSGFLKRHRAEIAREAAAVSRWQKSCITEEDIDD